MDATKPAAAPPDSPPDSAKVDMSHIVLPADAREIVAMCRLNEPLPADPKAALELVAKQQRILGNLAILAANRQWPGFARIMSEVGHVQQKLEKGEQAGPTPQKGEQAVTIVKP